MTAKEVLAELKKLGTEQTRKIYANHGAKGDMFGVKVADLKVIAKKIKGDQALALELYDTGNLDAMYLAGLVADGAKMSKAELNAWVKSAAWVWSSEYTVPWVASESPFGRELALTWMDSSKESIASAGWNTYGSIMGTKPDTELDLKEIEGLLERAVKEIPKAPNRVRYCMNGFVIAVGAFVKPLHAKAKAAAKKIGTVEVDMGGTACEVPNALEKITKVAEMRGVGKKRKSAKC